MTACLLQGDCCDLLPTLPVRSVQCIITSPPYFQQRDYKVPPKCWPEILYAPLAGVPAVTIPAMECCLGLEESPLAFVGHLVHVFRLCRPVLRDDGIIWLNLGDSYAQPSKWGGGTVPKKNYTSKLGRAPRRKLALDPGLKDKDLLGMPWRLALALQADGWYLRSDVIWEKTNGMCERVEDRPTRVHEYFLLLSRSRSYYYDRAEIDEPAVTYTGRRNKRSVWRIATNRGDKEHKHRATFPEELIELCVRAGTSPPACPTCNAPWKRVYEPTGHVNRCEPAHVPGNADTKTDSSGWAPTKVATNRWQPTCSCEGNDGCGKCVILDPFAGTGTVSRVAERLQRDSISIELNPEYHAVADQRTDGVQIAMVEVLDV